MGVVSDAAVSKGDLMRRVDALEEQVKQLRTARRLEAASIGRGGLRIQGGRLLAEDSALARVFEVTTEPPSIFMRQELISQLALTILGEAIRSAETPDEVVATSTSGAFVDLTGGPAVTDVTIGASGRALVIASAALFASPTGQDGEVTCYMGYAITGASTVAASTATAVHLGFTRGDGSASLHPGAEMSASKVSLVDGLNAGLHTFTAKYRVDEFNASDEGAFLFRNLTVIPF